MRPKPPQELVQPQNFFNRTQQRFSPFLRVVFRFDFIPLLSYTLIIAFYCGLLTTSKLERFENIVLDYFFKYRPPVAMNSSLAVIEIAEDSIQALGRWPWPRYYHAVLTYLLSQWQARAIVFDVIFSEESTALDDNALEEALQKSSSRVYLPVICESGNGENVCLHSLERFEKYARAVGHINFFPDPDAVIRRIQPFQKSGGESLAHLAIRVAYDLMEQKLPPPDQFPVPLDSKGNFLINWAGLWNKTYEHYSYLDLIKSFEAVQKGKPPLIDPEKIKNKIFLIGVTAPGLADIRANPLESQYPAVGVLANVVNSILTRQFVWPASPLMNILCLIIIGYFSYIFFVPFRNMISLIFALVLAGGWAGFAFFLFWRQGTWFYVLHPSLLILSNLIFSAAYAQIVGNKERRNLFDLATRDGLTGLYVIRHFRALINQAVRETRISSIPLSVILIDIDDFKSINDTHGHQAGDLVLKQTAQVISSHTRANRLPKEADVVARYGGEEFIIMLRGSNLTDAAFSVAERIRQAVEGSAYEWHDVHLKVTISLGVATLHPKETIPDLMVRRADAALYRAKREGKNRVCLEEKP